MKIDLMKRKTSLYYDLRNLERESGHTPDLIKNPIRVPIGYFTSRLCVWIVYSDGARTATPAEEEAWADGTLNLPYISPTRRLG